MLYKIEGFCHVHHAAEDTASILEEVADCFNDCPGIHIPRDSWLVDIFKIIDTNGSTKSKMIHISSYLYYFVQLNVQRSACKIPHLVPEEGIISERLHI